MDASASVYDGWMQLGLRGRVAVVAGASQGIGKAVATALAAEGADLALCARREEPLAELCAELESAYGVSTSFASVDIAQHSDVLTFVERALEHFGRIDICVPNAGGPPARGFLETTVQDWDSAFHQNLRSVVSFAQAVLPPMRHAGFGRIVAITSDTAKQAAPSLVLSNAIRPGVSGLVRSLSNEFARDGITANCVGPGLTDTARSREVLAARADAAGRSLDEQREETVRDIPTGRIATPEEVAAMVVWLCSEQAGSITGQTLLVDGGSYRGL